LLKKIQITILAVFIFTITFLNLGSINVSADEIDIYNSAVTNGYIDSSISFEKWSQAYNYPPPSDEVQVSPKFYLLQASPTTVYIKKGDILITNHTSYEGIIGHAAIAVSDNVILDIPNKYSTTRVKSAKKWLDQYTAEGDWVKIYRLPSAYSYIANRAADWAYKNYYSSNGGTEQDIKPEYDITPSLYSTDPTYCSKIVWQAYFFGTDEYVVSGAFSTNIVPPYSLISYFNYQYKPTHLYEFVRPNGWFALNDTWYHYGLNGSITSGWANLETEWYYLNPNYQDAMHAGWLYYGGKHYFFNLAANEQGPKGAMWTGWLPYGGKWYFLDLKNGDMKTGWLQLSNQNGSFWYYLNSPSGEMKTGWLQLGTSWYYLNPTGEMVTGPKTIDGKVYYFDVSGKLIN
jgi:glucan-binding YG repeat protein